MLLCCFKQKTAYERRMSDWSSDVCSSDLARAQVEDHLRLHAACYHGSIACKSLNAFVSHRTIYVVPPYAAAIKITANPNQGHRQFAALQTAMKSSAVSARTRPLAHGAMRFDPVAVPAPGEYLFDPADARLGAVPVGMGGRQAAWFVSGDFGAGVLRHYRRGGLIARISRDRYVWTGAQHTRSFAEFDLMHSMYKAGLPVPRPLAAAYWRTGAAYRSE